MIDHTFQALGFIMTAIVFWRTESVLNIMSRDCVLAIRLAFWLIVVGTASMNVAILNGYVPPVTVLLTLSGLTLLLIAERRISAILRLHTTIPHDRRTRR